MDALTEKLQADVAMLRAALEPFTRDHMSGEAFASTLERLSRAGQLRSDADRIERRDAEIQAAREAFAKTG